MVTALNSINGGLWAHSRDVAILDYFRCAAADGFEVQGLLSTASSAKTILLHVHGFGGDFIANRFVQQMHQALPGAGLAFASFNHRLCGYVVERYGERSVLYSGAAVSDANLSVLDLAAVVDFFKPSFDTIVIQGHSFGTNIVKSFARGSSWAGDLVFLSASDSLWLYDQWLLRHGSAKRQLELKLAAMSVDYDEVVVFGLFGIDLGNLCYSIPMSARGLKLLLSSDVFNEWSTCDTACLNRSIVMAGGDDPIAGGGGTGSLNKIMEWLPLATVRPISGVGHLFAGKETQLIEMLLEWIRGDGGRAAR